MITLDMKTLIRRGIPINLRGMVWKAIVDNRQASDLSCHHCLLLSMNPIAQLVNVN